MKLYEQDVIKREKVYDISRGKNVYEDMDHFVDEVSERINELGDKFVSLYYPTDKIAIILYKEDYDET